MHNRKRLAFYTFFEKSGNVKNYVIYYLKELYKISDSVLVIVNGYISEKGKQCFIDNGFEFIVRENKGFDFSAWKSAIDFKGWNYVKNFDELILCNCSCYGPFFPFSEVFDKMEEQSCDFWGLYRHPQIENILYAYLQSYFLVINKNLLNSIIFKKYWEELSVAKNWNEAVKQETLFTKYFEDNGFFSSSYINNFRYSELIENPTILFAPQLMMEYRFPLLKRKVFSENYGYFLENSLVNQAQICLDFIKFKTKYPVNYIYEDILNTMEGHVIRRILHDVYALNDKNMIISTYSKNKVALIVYSYFEDMVDDDIKYMLSMPVNSGVFIVVISEKLKKIWNNKKQYFHDYDFEIRIQENRGRNENAYWLTCRDVIQKYEFICVVHDKKTPSAVPPVKGYNFNIHCWDNLLKSRGYVSEVLSIFKKEPRLGLLMPPNLYFSDWRRFIFNNEWGKNLKIGYELYKKLNLHIPFDHAPDAPWGAMFWLRGKAMHPFYRYSWQINDFPKEPIPSDGTILHAMERMYPMIVQEGGFFSAWVFPISNIGILVDNMNECIKERNQINYIKSQEPPFKRGVKFCFFEFLKALKIFLKKHVCQISQRKQ